MKKAVFLLMAILMTSSAMGGVDITCSAVSDGNMAVITISYNANGEAIRAIALDVTLDGEATFIDVNCVNSDFTMYPGNINIAGDGTINDDGSCLCDNSYPGTLGGLDTNGVTIEMASLHVGVPGLRTANWSIWV